MNILTEALILIEYQDYYNPYFSSVYMFSTENTKEVVKGLNVKGKKVLTPSSSGDHIFEMLLSGAECVAASLK